MGLVLEVGLRIRGVRDGCNIADPGHVHDRAKRVPRNNIEIHAVGISAVPDDQIAVQTKARLELSSILRVNP